jgi:hypothetical protein
MGGPTATEGPIETLGSIHSVGSLDRLTVTDVGLTASLCLMLDRLINTCHKWSLLVRSMTPMRGYAYKRLGGSLE